MEVSNRKRARSTRRSYGGYDNHFTATFTDLEKYTCTVCTKVFRDPRLTACCGQHFCESCLMHWLREHSTCPNCREENFDHIVDKKFTREINSLTVRCSNKKDGCECKLELGSLKEHLESAGGCGYVLVECPNKCVITFGEETLVSKVKRKDLEIHLKDHCRKRPYECEHCGLKATFHSITRPFGHYTRCQEIPMVCPNNCGEERIKRKDMSTHRNVCPLELVDCPFRDTGCKIKLVRSDMAGHMESGVQGHLLLTAKAFTRIKKEKTAVSIHVNKMLEDCSIGRSQRVPLESIRTILDDSYHLRDEGDQLQLFTAVMTLKILRSGVRTYSIGAPCFFFQDGYKMRVRFGIIQNTSPPTRSEVIISLYLLQGEFDDILEWPLNSNNFDINLTLSVNTDRESSPSLESSSDSEVESSAGAPSACTDSETLTLQSQLTFCQECCGQLHKRLGCVTCSDMRRICANRYDSDISHAVAQKMIKGNKPLFTLTVCQHEHIKRRKQSSK